MKIHPWVAVASGVIVVAAALTISIAHTHEEALKNADANAVTLPVISVSAVSDSYKKGTHTISGSVNVPNACYAVTAKTSAGTPSTSSTTPAHIRVDLSVPPDTGMCLQLSEENPFSITASGAADAPIDVYLNGTFATSTND